MIIKCHPYSSVFATLLGVAVLLPASLVYAKSLQEQPPPWSTSSSTQTGGIEAWYRNRQAQMASQADTLDALQAKAEAGDVEAQYRLALVYQGQSGTTPDLAQAKQWLMRAAQAGHTKAQYALALLLRSDEDKADVQQSLHWQEQAAQGGLVEAQYDLGLLYANGQYVTANAQQAHYWLQQAASRGHQMANLALANSHLAASAPVPVESVSKPIPQRPQARVVVPKATPVAASEPQALVQAAAQPIVDDGVVRVKRRRAETVPTETTPSQQAVEPTLTEAPAIAAQPLSTEQAAVAGDPVDAWADQVTNEPQVQHNTSEVNLGTLTPDEIRDAAFKGDMYAQLMLGALYEDGSQGVQQDMEQAAKWYLKAARQGYAKAQHNLALLYEDGRGLTQSYEEAARWYQKAANDGFSEAQNNLAVLYIMGSGVPQDRQKAEELLRASVAQGNENAKRNLGMLLENADAS